MRKAKKPPGASLSLGNTAKVTKNMLPAKATEKSWLKKSQIMHEFYLVQRPYILDVVERTYKNKKRGGFVQLKRRGMGVFSRASHSFSRAVKLSKKKKKKKRKQTNNQQQKQRKRKTSVDKLHE